MDRAEIMAAMGELKLYRMRAAYDELMAVAVRRQHEPRQIVGELLAAEIGSEFGDADRTLYRPRVALGITQALSNPDSTVYASFVGAPGGFSYIGEDSRTRVNLEAGIDVLSARGFNARVNVTAQFDGDSTSLGAFAGVSYRF